MRWLLVTKDPTDGTGSASPSQPALIPAGTPRFSTVGMKTLRSGETASSHAAGVRERQGIGPGCQRGLSHGSLTAGPRSMAGLQTGVEANSMVSKHNRGTLAGDRKGSCQVLLHVSAVPGRCWVPESATQHLGPVWSENAGIQNCKVSRAKHEAMV